MEGVDYSFARPNPACLASRGIRFAVRYVGTPGSGKSLTVGETRALTGAGIAVAAVYQTTASFMADGNAGTGAAAARAARDHARSCGMPANRPVYFALDTDPAGISAARWRNVEAFLAGAAGVLGRGLVGVYGGFGAIERLVPGHARWGWQTYAWSGGRWSSKAHLRQYRNQVALCGGEVDLCRSITADFGQWGTGSEEEDMPSIDEIRTVVRQVVREELARDNDAADLLVKGDGRGVSDSHGARWYAVGALGKRHIENRDEVNNLIFAGKLRARAGNRPFVWRQSVVDSIDDVAVDPA